MKITNAERMITGNMNLSIFIRKRPPGIWLMVLQQSLLGYPRRYCEVYREWRPASLTKGNIMTKRLWRAGIEGAFPGKVRDAVGSSLLGKSPDIHLEYLVVLVVLVGIFQLIFGLLKLGMLLTIFPMRS
jgi:hypothetical protein